MYYFKKDDNSNIVTINIDLPNKLTEVVTTLNITNYKTDLEAWEMVERIINYLNE